MGVRFLPDRSPFLGGPVSGAAPTDSDVALWAAAVVANAGLVSDPRVALVSTLVAAWKAAGVWALTDDFWLLVAENVPQALTSLKQRRLAVSVSAPSFTIDRGYAFDGVVSHINTGFIPSTHAVAMTGSNMRLAVYERTNVAATTYAVGQLDSTNQNARLLPRTAGNSITGGLNSAAATVAGSVADSRGLTVLSRTAAPVFEGFKNGVSTGTVVPATNATVLPTRAIYIGAYNNAGTAAAFRAATEGFASVGASMSAAQELSFYTPLQAHFTALGANV